MSTAPQIGTIASKTDKLIVQRQGEQLALQQGDAILAGDVLQNKDLVSVDIELPALAEGQSDSLLTLSPESAAQIGSVASENGNMIEVTSLTDGVELFTTSEGAEGAMLIADTSGSFSGLVGAGLLSAGSVGGVSGLATAIGGGVGVAAIAASSGDDDSVEGSTFTDARVDNGDETTTPVEQPNNPDENENPMEPETPEEETPENQEDPLPPAADDPVGAIVGVIDDVLVSTPLEPLSDVLGMVTEALPIGSAPNPADSLPLDQVTSNLPF